MLPLAGERPVRLQGQHSRRAAPVGEAELGLRPGRARRNAEVRKRALPRLDGPARSPAAQAVELRDSGMDARAAPPNGGRVVDRRSRKETCRPPRVGGLASTAPRRARTTPSAPGRTAAPGSRFARPRASRSSPCARSAPTPRLGCQRRDHEGASVRILDVPAGTACSPIQESRACAPPFRQRP